MRTQVCTALAAFALTAFPAGGSAQTAPSAAAPGRGPAVVSDAAPPPAEDRSSPGAVVLDPALVRVMREQRSAPDTSVMGAAPQARSSASAGRSKAGASEELHRKGASSLVGP